jgi:hypothetical protein
LAFTEILRDTQNQRQEQEYADRIDGASQGSRRDRGSWTRSNPGHGTVGICCGGIEGSEVTRQLSK